MAFDNNEKDDFWDIKKLMPTPKPRPVPKAPYKPDSARVSEHHVQGSSAPSAECKLTATGGERRVNTYIPKNRFIRKITLTDYPMSFDFYGAFRNAALLYFDFKAPKCDFVGYYSYMPQYTQLSSEQKAFYFYFRSQVRAKNYIKTDYSYLYLYIYEIINLPDKISAKEGLEALTDLWCAYRKDLTKIDEKLVIWVRDYCILHALEAPIEKIGHFIFDIIAGIPLCEFYLTGFDEKGRAPSSVMCAYLSDYDWRKGKYAGGDSAKIYEKLMLGALDGVIGHMWRYGKIGTELTSAKSVSFTTFQGALCTREVKKNVTVEYSPISADREVRTDITEAVRYTENKLRALLGIKSRLLIKSQNAEYRKIIDEYFAAILKNEAAQRRLESTPEYEKLYVAESAELSEAGADEIERISWSTTVRLTEGSEDAPIFADEAPEISEQVSVAASTDATFTAQELALIEKSLQDGIMNSLPLAERLNELFLSELGDVVYESLGDSFSLIEDYREDVEKWLTNMKT